VRFGSGISSASSAAVFRVSAISFCAVVSITLMQLIFVTSGGWPETSAVNGIPEGQKVPRATARYYVATSTTSGDTSATR